MADTIQNFRFFSDSADIVLVALMFFYILKAIEGTRALQTLFGLGAVVLFYFISRAWGFYTLNWVITHFLGFAILIIVVLFQEDIRKGLANIGKKPLLFRFTKKRANNMIVEELIKACFFLSSKKIGAIIAIERRESLRSFEERPLNAVLSSELIISIFNPNSPLHDGAVIIRDDVIVSAGSFFPISMDIEFKMELGTRHRAAIQLSRETDAVVVVISEETGVISVVTNGELRKAASRESLRSSLASEFGGTDATDLKTPAAEKI